MESWLLLLSWSSESLVDILRNSSVSIIVWMDAIVHELRAAQVMTSKGIEVVDDMVLTKSQLLGDLWDQLRKGVIDNRLLKVADTFNVQRWWNHEVDLWSRFELHKSLSHLDVVRNVLLFIPVLWFGVVGSKLDHNDIRLRIEGVLVRLSLNIWHISCSDHASPGIAVVLNFEGFESNLLLPKLQKFR